MQNRITAVLLLLLTSLPALALNEADLLPPEKAFRAEAVRVAPDRLEVRYAIADGYYLYRKKFRFALEGGPVPGEAQYPAGKVKQDPYFGPVETYRHNVVITLPFSGAQAGALVLKATAQGCADAGICYPPNTQVLNVAAASSAVQSPRAGGLDALGESAADGQGGFIAGLRDQGVGVLLGFFFLAGLGMAFTACMYPLVPIISGIIVGDGPHTSKARGFGLSLAYVQGMALTYAAAGVVAGRTGSLLSNALQTPWVLGVFGLMFVVMAGAMFGMYQIQLPSSLQSRLSDQSNRLHGGKLASVFVMGMLSALIIGPCVAPPLALALGYIGTTGDWLLGGVSLYVMALGIGLPLMVVGIFGGQLLPKAGPWMNSIRAFFGVVMLAMAIWMVSPVLPAVVVMVAWAVLLIVCSIFLHALDGLPVNASGWTRLWKGVGVISLLAGAALLIGTLAGNRDVLQPLKSFVVSSNAGDGSLASATRFVRVTTAQELDRQLQAANGRPVMLDFYADWCVSCKEMERLSFADPAVREKLKGMHLLQVDVTRNVDSDQALLKRFGLFGPPGIIFFRQGLEIPGAAVIGFQDAPAFLSHLNRFFP